MPAITLIQAAEMRSAGVSWELVGEAVGELPKDCKEWPRLFRNEWEPLYREAAQRRYDEASDEALAVLRVLLRDDDEKVKLRSADVILRVQHQRMLAFPPPPPMSEIDMATMKRGREGEEGDVYYRDRLNRQHAAVGLPPCTEAELQESIMVEFDKCRAAKAKAKLQKLNQTAPPDPDRDPDPNPPFQGTSNGGYGFSDVADRMALGVLMFIATLVIMAISQQKAESADSLNGGFPPAISMAEACRDIRKQTTFLEQPASSPSPRPSPRKAGEREKDHLPYAGVGESLKLPSASCHDVRLSFSPIAFLRLPTKPQAATSPIVPILPTNRIASGDPYSTSSFPPVFRPVRSFHNVDLIVSPNSLTRQRTHPPNLNAW